MSTQYPEATKDSEARDSTDGAEPEKPSLENTGLENTASENTGADGAADGAGESDTPTDESDHGEDWDAPVVRRRSTMPEACTVIGLILIGALLIGAQPIQLLAELSGQQMGQGQMAGLTNLIMSNGLLAGLAAVFGIVGLTTRGPATSAWVQWTATAVVVVGVLFFLVAAVSFPMIPAEQAPVMPQAPQ